MSAVDHEPGRIIRIALVPPIDRPTMRVLLPAFLDTLDAEATPRLLIILNEMTLPTLGAVWTELPYLPRIWRHLKRIDRVAVVSDARGVRGTASVKSRLLRHTETRLFASSEETAARFWLMGEA